MFMDIGIIRSGRIGSILRWKAIDAGLSMNAKQGIATALGLVALLVTIECGGNDQDPTWHVSRYRDGQRASDLRRDVGPTTHQRRIDESCRELSDGSPEWMCGNAELGSISGSSSN
jgi:hypothetical protein